MRGKQAMRLYINVDHVATVRQARRADEPDPIRAALLCERGGADGITVHLREDRRHIQDDDVHALAGAVTTVLNLELATVKEIVGIAAELKPHQATLVPERRQEITTEGGLDLRVGEPPNPRLVGAIGDLAAAGIRVSLFIDPDLPTIDRAAYANHYRSSTEPLERLREASSHASSLGLAVHAGHGLTYENVQPVAAIPEIEELNIGHTIVSRSVMAGIEVAVKEMRRLVDAAR
jgi:pyridoxine 5-phosphate synthase